MENGGLVLGWWKNCIILPIKNPLKVKLNKLYCSI